MNQDLETTVATWDGIFTNNSASVYHWTPLDRKEGLLYSYALVAFPQFRAKDGWSNIFENGNYPLAQGCS